MCVCVCVRVYISICLLVLFNTWRRNEGGGRAHLLFVGEGVAKPVQTLVEAVTGGSGCTLDVPLPVPELVETETLGDFLDLHSVGEILLVSEDEEHSFPEFIFGQHTVEFVLCGVVVAVRVVDTFAVVGVDDKNDTLSVLVVVAPQRADLVLATDIPYREGNVFVFNRLDIKTDGRDSGNNFTQLQLVQDSSLTSGVKTNHQNAHVRFAEHTAPELGECHPHVYLCVSQ
mmetsp:Transcript_17334/g.24285  ORF Transcript_17334/g.24285 Transcript_17334/m.24285 type:complete len:229 (+) Transcript_17334:295-981(+)